MVFAFFHCNVHAQEYYGIPKALAQTADQSGRQPTPAEIQANYNSLINNPDTALNHEKKMAMRWMEYVFSRYNLDGNGSPSRKPYSDAMKAIYASPQQCGGIDDADWQSDGPIYTGTSQHGGWVDAIYNNPTALNEYIIGTRTSGIMRSTDGGEHWHSVTDDLDFPVLGVRQFIAVPGEPNHIIALTGHEWNEGSVIYSENGGADWNLVDQPLPEFLWMDFHPTIDGLAFATAEEEIYYTMDYGLTWTSLGAPPGYISLHKTFWTILVLSDRFFVTNAYHYTNHGVELYRGNYTVSQSSVSVNWEDELTQTLLPPGDTAFHIGLSNKVDSRFYMNISTTLPSVSPSRSTTFKTSDEGDNFRNAIKVGGGVLNKYELIASVNDTNVVYYGSTFYMSRVDETDFIIHPNGTIKFNSTSIDGYPGNSGTHLDYRCSQIINHNGVDRILFGNDGGPALVPDGLAANPLMESLNGDLSINLLHGFDVHEPTGKIGYAFQDHGMTVGYTDGSFGDAFHSEGAGIMIQKGFPTSYVGSLYSSIQDNSTSLHPIVDGYLASERVYLHGYFVPYLHFPDRFIEGISQDTLGYGGVAMNRAAMVSQVINISPKEIGPTAICEQYPETIYASSYQDDSPGADLLFLKSVDDGYTWTDLSDSPVALDGGGTVWNLNDAIQWNTVRAIAVDHTDPDLVYCGIGATHTYNGAVTDERLRVIRSFDGGNSFSDYSEGLPALPVERLLTIASDNATIFCATSVGVYYRNNTMPQWECFSQNLPKAMVTGMKYNYCNKTLYVSTYGRGIWKTEVPFNIANSTVQEITENTVWDEPRVYYTDIHIQPGATLTLEDTLFLSSEASIIIEPDAKLVVDGGMITNICGNYWQGIQVVGQANKVQTAEFQGTLILKNGAVVQNARNAISVWKKGDYCTSGGIVQATDATFRNNRRSVEFIKYPQSVCSKPPVSLLRVPNKSFFKNCLFENNDDNLFLENEIPKSMVTLWGVRGLGFIGCKFKTNTSVATSEGRSKAIYSIDADFTVDGYCNGIIPIGEPCPDYVPSTLTGFNTAVHATGAEQNPAPKVKNTVFDKNMLGTYFFEADHATALFNEFVVGDHNFPPLEPPIDDDANYHTAIKAEDTSFFTIEENTVIEAADPAADYTHGILVVNSGGQSVELYKNDYSDLTAASIAVGKNNDNLVGFYGLRFICNQNNQNQHDFEIRKDDQLNFGYISIYQSGLDGPLQAAGNTFSDADGLNENYVHADFFSDADYLYRYDDTAQEQTSNPDEIYVSDGSLTPEAGGTPNTCPTHFPVMGIDTPFELGKYQSAKVGYYNLLYTYHQFIDKGNTEGTLNDIALAWPEDAWAMRNELMYRSPYNSDTVLIAAADKNIMPHGMLLEVLIANPDALRGGKVIEHVKCCIPDPMPTYMTDILEGAKNVRTARTLMEHTIGNLHAEMSRAHRKLMLHYVTDTVGTHPDTLIAWYDEIKTREGRYALAMEQVYQNKYSDAHITLDSLENSLRLTGAQKTELAETRKYINFLEAVYNDDRTIAQLDTAEVIALKAIANKNNGGTAAARADNILCFIYGICKPPVGYPKSDPGTAKKPKPKLEELLDAQNHVKAMPNPADQYIELEYTLLFEKEDTYLKVWDIQGRQIETWQIGRSGRGLKLLDTRRLDAGVYIVELVQDGRRVFSDKFIVQH